MHLFFTIILLLNLSISAGQREGFYKDLFMDGGISLTSRTSLPVAQSLNLSMEYIASSDSVYQRQVMISNSVDENGVLLYPDGAPRFAMIYLNGGSATHHGISLGETGRERIRTFYYHGGSYSGSCAGAFIASTSYMAEGIYEPYFHIWPGRMTQAGLVATPTGHFIPSNSPLLHYCDFGDDLYISNVYHNYGGYAREDLDYPVGTEVLLRYDYPTKSMHQKPSCWAYKKSDTTGRIVVIGSHPESVTSGERLNLMEAIFSYALEGVATPKLKAELQNNSPRFMNKNTHDHNPDFAKIGDLQYHHFVVNIPKNAHNIKFILSGNDNYDMHLYVHQGDFAFDGASTFSNKHLGSNKLLAMPTLPEGKWYVGVKCLTTVQAHKEDGRYSYSGSLDVLNGVSYSIMASWDTTDTQQNMDFVLYQNFPNPFNVETAIYYQVYQESEIELTVVNILGEKIATLVSQDKPIGIYEVIWNASMLPSGEYFIQIQSGNGHIQTQKAIFVK